MWKLIEMTLKNQKNKYIEAVVGSPYEFFSGRIKGYYTKYLKWIEKRWKFKRQKWINCQFLGAFRDSCYPISKHKIEKFRIWRMSITFILTVTCLSISIYIVESTLNESSGIYFFSLHWLRLNELFLKIQLVRLIVWAPILGSKSFSLYWDPPLTPIKLSHQDNLKVPFQCLCRKDCPRIKWEIQFIENWGHNFSWTFFEFWS